MAKKIQKPKPLKPVYLIYGDKKMIDDALARLKKRLSAQLDLDFNFDQFNGLQSTAQEIIQAANTLPFMSEKRLVIVKEVDKLPKDEISKLAGYVENPSPTTCLVLVAESIDKASKLYKAVEKNGEVAEYKLGGSPLAWIKNQFAERGKIVSDNVARHLIHMVGSDLQRLSLEIEKVSLFHDSERIIDPLDIEPMITKSVEISVFDLVDSIGERNIAKAIEILDGLLLQKESPIGILNLISRHFRLVLRVKIWTEKGHDNKYLVEHLTGEGGKKLPYFVVAKYREQSRNFSTSELKRAFEYLLKADISLKSSLQPPDAILTDLIIELAS
ncbi:MAG: DNA polymerase III subunit delta [Actinomycetota bacterium]|nr:DNA polymerase III subunit delta [Actinomycetota bacterium]